MTRSGEPPDWALPAWDAAGDGEPPDPRTMPVPGGVGLRIRSVAELTRSIRDALRAEEGLRDVWVEGEVGRVTVSSAGHGYFTLKDERAQLPCVMFREELRASAFEPRTGHRIVAHGRIDVFESSGLYQLYVDAIQPAGFGELTLRFEALKAQLAAEGLFDGGRKRALPLRPRTIAVVTSETGAVWHDIRTVVERRWPLTRLVLVPCRVQGDGAPRSIVAALDVVARWAAVCTADGRVDEAPAVTILARGGGSLEDLWAFNDERVVRAVVAHPLPVVCGVGHEVDVTLADFAADVRAPTPSAAAELCVPDGREILDLVAARRARLDVAFAEIRRRLGRELAGERRALDALRPAAQLAAARERAGLLLDRATRVLRDRLDEGTRGTGRAWERLGPLGPRRIAGAAALLERTYARVPGLGAARVARAGAELRTAAAGLSALAPAATLARGYAIVRTPDGAILRRPAGAPAGTTLAIDLAEGRLGATSTGPGGADPSP